MRAEDYGWDEEKYTKVICTLAELDFENNSICRAQARFLRELLEKRLHFLSVGPTTHLYFKMMPLGKSLIFDWLVELVFSPSDLDTLKKHAEEAVGT